jgi:hypothetical protein
MQRRSLPFSLFESSGCGVQLVWIPGHPPHHGELYASRLHQAARPFSLIRISLAKFHISKDDSSAAYTNTRATKSFRPLYHHPLQQILKCLIVELCHEAFIYKTLFARLLANTFSFKAQKSPF